MFSLPEVQMEFCDRQQNVSLPNLLRAARERHHVQEFLPTLITQGSATSPPFQQMSTHNRGLLSGYGSPQIWPTFHGLYLGCSGKDRHQGGNMRLLAFPAKEWKNSKLPFSLSTFPQQPTNPCKLPPAPLKYLLNLDQYFTRMSKMTISPTFHQLEKLLDQ